MAYPESHWNYRAVRHVCDKTGEEWLAFHEVYYRHDEPNGVTTDSICPSGGTVEDLRWVLLRMLEALEKPVLDYDSLAPEERESD